MRSMPSKRDNQQLRAVIDALYEAALEGNASAAKAWLEYKGFMPVREKPAPEPVASPFADLDTPGANVTPIRRGK